MIQDLLESEISDLAEIGLYILSLRWTNVDLERFTENPIAAHNVARFLHAEFGLDGARDLIKESENLWQTLGGDLENISSTVIQAAPAPLAASTVQDMTMNVHGTEAVSEAIQAAPAPLTAPTVQDMTIIVHGTRAATETWWRQGSPFWNYIDGIVGNVYAGPDPFSWSGAYKHAARLQAAQELLSWVHAHPATNLQIIAHSHGGNVCLVASRLGLNIRKLINLGTPIRLEYLPDLNVIDVLHNVFSTGDRVQTPAGTIPNRRADGRTLGDSVKTANHRATDDGKGRNPGHSDLHEPATWSNSNLDSLL